MKIAPHAKPESSLGRPAPGIERAPASFPETSLADHRPEAIAQRRVAAEIQRGPYMAAQRRQMNDLFGQAAAPPNRTGLPDGLKSGVEALSGLSMDGVKVHYNSPEPSQLSALAYAQGTDIHVAPGQEHHLPHEAWHVVQQAQGRVQPTMQTAGGVSINDDAGLEHEADLMGARASDGAAQRVAMNPDPGDSGSVAAGGASAGHARSPVQRQLVGDLAGKRFDEVLAALSRNEQLNPELRPFIDNADTDTLNKFVAYLSGIGDALDTQAILDRDWTLTLRAPQFAGASRGIEQRVRDALAEIPTGELGKDKILAGFETHFRNHRLGLHGATREPGFSETLLECIRTRQSQGWVTATERQNVPHVDWANEELQHWNVRHYTSKLMVVLGEDLGEGIFRIADLAAPPFGEIISTVTLATMPVTGGPIQNAKRPGDRMMMTFTGGASSSGHTTGLDWANVGNVGDTFYGLFYKDKPATGITPPFIMDAVYYAIWPVTEFGSGWASADWLGTAADSRKENGKTPEGIARKGELSDVIASIFPEAATRDFSGNRNVETPESEEQRKAAFAAMGNFEVKKHGPMAVRAWIPVTGNIDKTRNWWVDTTKGKFIKLRALLPKSVREKLED